MQSTDILKKEDEFYKENEKLEQRTKELMKKVNDVMKIQENLMKETLSTQIEFNATKITSTNIKEKYNCLEQLKLTEEIKNEDLNIPNSVDEMGKKGAMLFYKTKIKALQEENANLKTENKKKSEETKKLQKENQSIMEEKDKWFASYNTAKNTIGKLESQLCSLNLKLQNKECEMSSLRKELEQTKKELKNLNLNLNNFEIRMNRAYEENDKLKTTLKTTKEEEKELKESYKKQINDLTSTMKRIEQHKIGLLNGFRKQMQLLDILKKQKMYLETYKLSELSESEYVKLLNWKLD